MIGCIIKKRAKYWDANVHGSEGVKNPKEEYYGDGTDGKTYSTGGGTKTVKLGENGNWGYVDAANPGGAQELAKYGRIVSFGNGSISGGHGGGLAYELGTIETDKGWLQDYQTIYSIAGFGISGGFTGGVIIAKGNSRPTFSDWKGFVTGGSVSYGFFSASVGISTNYYAIGGGFGWGRGVKSKWNGNYSYSMSFLIGKPYRLPPVDFSRSYISTQTYLGGQ